MLGLINSHCTKLHEAIALPRPFNSRPCIREQPSNVLHTDRKTYITLLANYIKVWNASQIAAANSDPYLFFYPLLHIPAWKLSLSIVEIRYAHNGFFYEDIGGLSVRDSGRVNNTFRTLMSTNADRKVAGRNLRNSRLMFQTRRLYRHCSGPGGPTKDVSQGPVTQR